MTGAEIVAAKVVKDLAAAALKNAGGDSSTTQQLQEIAKTSPTMQAAAETYARRIAVKQSILLKLYQPLAKVLGVAQDYFDDDFAADMAAKTTDIPDDDLKSPRPSVALPAMQGLAYSLDEPDLKEMYLNLLTTATDARRSDDAHPSFAEIIKQLSPQEAKLLLGCLRQRHIAIVRIKADLAPPNTGFLILKNHLLDWTDSGTKQPVEIEMSPVYVDNWIRLGLVEVTYAEGLTGEDSYSWVEGRPEYQKVSDENQSDVESMIGFIKGVFRSTDFGRRFAVAVST